MEQKIKELGTYCFEHDISLEDLKVIRKELQTKQLRKEFVNNEHIQNFLNLKDKCTITGNLKIDLYLNTLKKGNKHVTIHESEFLILQLLMANPHKTIKDEEILSLLKTYGYDIELKSLVVYVSRISHKIGKNTKQEKYIKRHWKQGYYWNAKVLIQGESDFS